MRTILLAVLYMVRNTRLAFKQHIEFSEGRPMTEKHEPIQIGFSILSFFPQHLQTKHITEWKKCEEERKEMESRRKKQQSNATAKQQTLPSIIQRSSEYPS